MKTALKFAVSALVLGLAAMVLVQATLDEIHLDNSRQAGLAAAAPLFGVALLALAIAVRRRAEPDAPLAPSRRKDLAILLALASVWSFGILMIWGL